jgi:hypothetical protein
MKRAADRGAFMPATNLFKFDKVEQVPDLSDYVVRVLFRGSCCRIKSVYYFIEGSEDGLKVQPCRG